MTDSSRSGKKNRKTHFVKSVEPLGEGMEEKCGKNGGTGGL